MATFKFNMRVDMRKSSQRHFNVGFDLSIIKRDFYPSSPRGYHNYFCSNGSSPSNNASRFIVILSYCFLILGSSGAFGSGVTV